MANAGEIANADGDIQLEDPTMRAMCGRVLVMREQAEVAKSFGWRIVGGDGVLIIVERGFGEQADFHQRR